MPYLLKEYMDFDLSKDKIKQEPAIIQTENMKEFNLSTVNPANIYEIEAIHGYPLATRNYTRYMPEALRGCIDSWTKPYPRPLIKFHNDIDGETIGRIIEATYIENSPSTNTPCIKVKAAISKQEAVADIENNILLTVSIGTGVSDCRCSICGKDYFSGECEHTRGNTYEGETCYIDIYKMEARELSFVIVPSDPYAMLVNHNKPFNPFRKEQDSQIEQRKEMQEKLEKIEEQAKFIEMKEALEAKISEKETEIANLTTSVQEKEGEIGTLQTSIQEKDAEIESLKAQMQTKTSLLESAENSLTETEKELKTVLVDVIESYRAILKKREVDKDTYLNRTTESLQDTVADLKEELSVMIPEKIINKESLVEDKIMEKETKKDNKESNLSIEERFAQMF